MYKILQKSIIGIMAFLICAVMFTSTAYAYTAVDVKLPVEVKIEGQLPEVEEEYHIQLKAEGDCPMPEGSERGIYTLIVPGEGKMTFPSISFPKVGVYEYTIIQIPGENETCTYDTTIYHVFVYVTNGKNETLEVTVIVYENDTTRKSDDILFINKYKEDILPEKPDNPPAVDTGDDTEIMQWALFTVSCLVTVLFLIKVKISINTER